MKRRFEEAAANELQQGWNRKTNKTRDQEMRIRKVVDEIQKKEEERREGEVREILRNRASDGGDDGGVAMRVETETEREDLDEMFSSRYGRVRQERM